MPEPTNLPKHVVKTIENSKPNDDKNLAKIPKPKEEAKSVATKPKQDTSINKKYYPDKKPEFSPEDLAGKN
jgi:hypothetical protein